MLKKGRIQKVKIKDASSPGTGGLFNIIVDHWWAVTPDDEIMFYSPKRNDWGSPQCNHDEHTARVIHKKLYPECKVQQVPVVYVPIDPQNYVY